MRAAVSLSCSEIGRGRRRHHRNNSVAQLLLRGDDCRLMSNPTYGDYALLTEYGIIAPKIG
jgi:hypothetical protein